MTLDEAIAHAEEQSRRIGEYAIKADIDQIMTEEEAEKCRACAEEHWQLAEWLNELKELRELKPVRPKRLG